MPSPSRLLVALAVLALLGRAGVVAWSHRDLAVAVWRGIRPRHVAGALALLVLVVAVTVGAMLAVPPLQHGIGDLVGTDGGNVVFAPVDVATEVATDAETGLLDRPAVVVAAVTVFLLLLGLLLPWFAFVEEETFRAGAETWSLPRRVTTALVFGAAHLVMLVPLAAALGIAVAGWAYTVAYRRGVRGGRGAPPAAVDAFRPTRRSAAALAAAGTADPATVDAHRLDQVAGVYAATVWHTTFNTTVVLLVWVTLVVDALG